MGIKISYLEASIMVNVEDIIVSKSASILDVLKIIDKSSKQLALVVDEEKKLLGTVSDGDIRRGLLRNISLDESIEHIYGRNPIIATINNSRDEIIQLCIKHKIHQIPIIDANYNILGIEILDELVAKSHKKNRVILMVGGLGTRLRPLTENIPKPMLHVGNKPILQTIVEKFVSYGFCDITMCVNYKLHIIKDYFQDGSKFGANIDYVVEDKRMGTAGALSILKNIPEEPFFVMNGDLLTSVNFEHLLNYHTINNSIATMCVKEYDFQVPYGVINMDENKIISIDEKPIHHFFVNAGIYMLSPMVLQYIPSGEYFDMPSLFEKIIKENHKTLSFPIIEYWLDIGKMDEYKKANDEYAEMFE
jgi:dTDP-glucose pyrophosphorylase/CBS domain-containing protein